MLLLDVAIGVTRFYFVPSLIRSGRCVSCALHDTYAVESAKSISMLGVCLESQSFNLADL